jgi:hypothetical protein
MVTEHEAGRAQDWEEFYLRKEADQAYRDRTHQAMLDVKVNQARQTFIMRLKENNYDFDKTLATFDEAGKTALGVNDTRPGYAYKEFTDGLKAELDPLHRTMRDIAEEQGLITQPVVEGDAKLKQDTYLAYVNFLVNDLNGIPNVPGAFDFNSAGARLLDSDTAGTWTFTAETHASSSYVTGERKATLIDNAQKEVVNAYKKDRKTIEQLDPELVKLASADKNFRGNYENYIVADAQSQIYLEFNRTQFTYHDMDQRLVAIASRDPGFIGAVEHYYEVLSQQARETGLTITEVARLNALEANDQYVEIGKLNDARNKIIANTQERNQKQIDAYNANIIKELSMYGTNLEAIIRNINEQSLLTGHTFLYASNAADLYKQLHMEMPEVELVDPDAEIPETQIGDPNRIPTYQDLTIMYPEQYQRIYQTQLANGKTPDEANAAAEETLRILYEQYPKPLPKIISVKPAKGRKVGDTAIFGYRYGLTDEQNQELEAMISSGQITRANAEAQAALIKERDKYMFEKTDQEKADELGLSLEKYNEIYGIVTEPEPKQPIDGEPTYAQLKTMYPEAYQSLQRKYANDPDADTKIEASLIRGHKAGNVPAEVNPTQPTQPNGEPTYAQLKLMYPDNYQRIVESQTRGGNQADDAAIEESLRITYENYPRPLPGTTTPTQPTQPTQPTPSAATTPAREPTYEELKIMYPTRYELFHNAYLKSDPTNAEQYTETMLKSEHAYRIEDGTSAPLPTQPTQPTPSTATTPAREPTYEELKIMYPARYELFHNAYLKSDNPSMAEQYTETMLKSEHAYRIEDGTSAPLPTQPTPAPTQPTPSAATTPTPTTQRPGLDIVPEFVPGARSHEYMNSIVEPQYNAPTTTTTNP